MRLAASAVAVREVDAAGDHVRDHQDGHRLPVESELEEVFDASSLVVQGDALDVLTRSPLDDPLEQGIKIIEDKLVVESSAACVRDAFCDLTGV